MISTPLASIRHPIHHHHNRLAFILCIITVLVPISLCFNINEENDYTLWRNSDANTYDNYVYIGLKEDQTDAQVAIHWSLIGDDEKRIQVCLVAEAKGWLAFGLAESGGMPGSDIVVYSKSDDQLTDYYATKYASPVMDDSQDWTLRDSSASTDNFIIWEGERLVDTGDVHHDWKFVDDSIIGVHAPTRIIVAWGDDMSVSAGQLVYHGNNRAAGEARFFVAPGEEASTLTLLEEESDGSLVVGAVDYVIPSSETTYADFSFSYNDMVAAGLPDGEEVHVIGFAPIVNHVENVHHFTLYAEADGNDIESMVYVWAAGGSAQILPSQAGFRFGPNAYNHLELEIHYDNPLFTSGIVDSSGVQIFYTSTFREYDAGVFQVGDPSVMLRGQQVGAGITKHTFTCPSTCTKRSDVPLTIFGESLHMHAIGATMNHRVIRNNEVVHENTVQYFDFEQSGAYLVPQDSYVLEPGDSMETECFYKDSTNGVIKFGLSSSDEMCITFLWYFPKRNLEFCGIFFDNDCLGSYNRETLDDEGEIGRTFGIERQLTTSPTRGPSKHPSVMPTVTMTKEPTVAPSNKEISAAPSSDQRSISPTRSTSSYPSIMPTVTKTNEPSNKDTSVVPSSMPTTAKTDEPTDAPSNKESSTAPSSNQISVAPTQSPSRYPSMMPSLPKTNEPTVAPSHKQESTAPPSEQSSTSPTLNPSRYPSIIPTITQTYEPTVTPSNEEASTTPSSNQSSISPTRDSSRYPSIMPTFTKSNEPTDAPSNKDLSAAPSSNQSSITPTRGPSTPPTLTKSNEPTGAPSKKDVSAAPSSNQSSSPTLLKTSLPSLILSEISPSVFPSVTPIVDITTSPSIYRTRLPTASPTEAPSYRITSSTPTGKFVTSSPTSMEFTLGPIASSGDVPSSSSFRVLSTVKFSTVLSMVLIVGVHLYLVQE